MCFGDLLSAQYSKANLDESALFLYAASIGPSVKEGIKETQTVIRKNVMMLSEYEP